MGYKTTYKTKVIFVSVPLHFTWEIYEIPDSWNEPSQAAK